MPFDLAEIVGTGIVSPSPFAVKQPPFIQANTNGRLHPASEPSLSPLNRGFLYGDAIYEVWRTYHGVIFGWEEHWNRLQRSAKALYLDLPFTQESILAEIKQTTEAFRRRTVFKGELYIRLQVTRGAGAIGLDTNLADQTDFVLLVQPCPELTPEKIAHGLKLSIARDLRRNPADALNPAWKTGNYLNNLLCLREARARGADEVVILNQKGQITEAAVCNIGFIRKGEFVTPALSAGILEGITRQLIVQQIAQRAGLTVREELLTPADLGPIDECFLLSSTKDVAPVAAIDEHRFRVGPDTVSLKLKAAFAAYAREQAEAHRSRLSV